MGLRSQLYRPCLLRGLTMLVAMLLGGAMQVYAHVVAPPATYEFGLSLATGQNGQLFTLFVVKVFEGNIIESTPLSREQFIRQVQGRTFSKANTDAEDLFRKYGVAACTLPADSAAKGYLTDCLTLDNLWKLRFWEYPYAMGERGRMGKGWAEKPTIPGERQLLLLSEYGITYTTALCYGENMFRLLRDMGDPAWVENYRKGG